MQNQKALKAFIQLRRALGQANAQALLPLGLGPAQAAVLRALESNGPQSAVALARATAHDPAAVNRALTGLLRKKMLRREQDRQDKRRSSLSLTAAGRALARRVARVHAELSDAMLAGLGRAEREPFIRALEKTGAFLHARNAQRLLPED
ncbi:MAG TPA: MarR family transcriptional regulator [bacterium]|jgi:DNA-binding MarR family transcriptional regulator|nr:MarR family transcriptional regulator [bacterium]HXB98122.1 MarR family transcriptional regulator [bacterium]